MKATQTIALCVLYLFATFILNKQPYVTLLSHFPYLCNIFKFNFFTFCIYFNFPHDSSSSNFFRCQPEVFFNILLNNFGFKKGFTQKHTSLLDSQEAFLPPSRRTDFHLNGSSPKLLSHCHF